MPRVALPVLLVLATMLMLAGYASTSAAPLPVDGAPSAPGVKR